MDSVRCEECDGSGYVEVCIGLCHYIMGDFPRYVREPCEECDGRGYIKIEGNESASVSSPEAMLAAKAIHGLGRNATLTAIAMCIDAAFEPKPQPYRRKR